MCQMTPVRGDPGKGGKSTSSLPTNGGMGDGAEVEIYKYIDKSRKIQG